MITEIPEEIIENTRLCRHKHGCLYSRAIFPLCIATGEKRGDGIVVKEKSYCLGECSYHIDTAGPDRDQFALCFCPVYVESFTRNGK